jgi:probable HAF family extracellular repeat protein
MKRLLCALVPACLLLTAVSSARADFIPIDVPGATSTIPLGFDGNNVWGEYGTNQGDSTFLYNGSTYTTININVPGAYTTHVTGIQGQTIVGYYGNGKANQESGFIYDGSSFTTLNAPGALLTMPSGVSNGEVVGNWTDASFNSHAFQYENGSFSSISVPGAKTTTVNEIYDGEIVGSYYDDHQSHGFLFENGHYETLDFPSGYWGGPGSNESTNLVGISAAGIVGYVGPNVMFVKTNSGPWTPFQLNEGVGANIYGISSDGRIVGTYTEAGDLRARGFELTNLSSVTILPEPSSCVLTLLGGVGLAGAWWRKRRVCA